MKHLLFTFTIIISVIFCSCNNEVEQPTALNDDGSYTIKISSPSLNGNESSTSARMITGNYTVNATTWTRYFSFHWNGGDVLRITPYDSKNVQIGEVISSVIPDEYEETTDDIEITVTFPNGTDHFNIECGPENDIVPGLQPCEFNQIKKGMMLFAAKNCKLNGTTVEMKAQWPVLYISPTYDFSYAKASGAKKSNTDIHVGIAQVIVHQYFSSTEEYTYYYKNDATTTSHAYNSDLVTPCPIVVKPAVDKPCSLAISIQYDNNYFYGDVDNVTDKDLRPETAVGTADMYTSTTPSINLEGGHAYTFTLKPELCSVSWVWVNK